MRHERSIRHQIRVSQNVHGSNRLERLRRGKSNRGLPLPIRLCSRLEPQVRQQIRMWLPNN